jgi:membrane-bound lytic murein transglycosylase D
MKNKNQPFDFRIKLVIQLFILFCLCGCSQSANQFDSNDAHITSNSKKQIWNRLRNNYHLANMNATRQDLKNKKTSSAHQPIEAQLKVQKYVKKYKTEKTLDKATVQATPYLYHIVEQLEKRNMPGELALLPIIESSFQPLATSNRGAAGIWQFIPSTGRHFGLKQDNWYDGRRDILASTKAALDYLQFLHKEFDENWMLALAAYNCGEGTVQRAINRNKRAGKPTTFWDLKLPKETKEYVPKFLALVEVVKNPEKHNVALASIENQPYFKLVNPGIHLNFKQAAKLSGVNITELKQLNPGYRRAGTHPKGPQQLLLPVANAEMFEFNLAKNR